MAPINDQWRRAFAKQSANDLEVYKRLCVGGVPVCQRLHFLQMHLEKLAKAHIYNTTQNVPQQTSHSVAAKVLPLALREERRRLKMPNLRDDEVWELRAILKEVDYLAPAVKGDGTRLDNCEYPWYDAVTMMVRVPVEHQFSVARGCPQIQSIMQATCTTAR